MVSLPLAKIIIVGAIKTLISAHKEGASSISIFIDLTIGKFESILFTLQSKSSLPQKFFPVKKHKSKSEVSTSFENSLSEVNLFIIEFSFNLNEIYLILILNYTKESTDLSQYYNML